MADSRGARNFNKRIRKHLRLKQLLNYLPCVNCQEDTKAHIDMKMKKIILYLCSTILGFNGTSFLDYGSAIGGRVTHYLYGREDDHLLH